MIKLSKYCVGIKPKHLEEMKLANDALLKSKEHLFVFLIPESVVEDLKKGDIGEWE